MLAFAVKRACGQYDSGCYRQRFLRVFRVDVVMLPGAYRFTSHVPRKWKMVAWPGRKTMLRPHTRKRLHTPLCQRFPGSVCTSVRTQNAPRMITWGVWLILLIPSDVAGEFLVRLDLDRTSCLRPSVPLRPLQLGQTWPIQAGQSQTTETRTGRYKYESHEWLTVQFFAFPFLRKTWGRGFLSVDESR